MAGLLAPEAADARVRDVPASIQACVRPGCRRRASTTLRFDYASRTVMLDPVGGSHGPGAYHLCFQHAARSGPPAGWTIRDRAPSRDRAADTPPPVGPSRDRGVDRLAAALSAVPRAVSEDAPDAVPVRADRTAAGRPSPLAPLLQPSSVHHGAVPVARPSAADPAPRPPASDPVATLAAPAPAPASEAMVPQPLRLVADPVGSVWCADLLPPRGPDPMGEGA